MARVAIPLKCGDDVVRDFLFDTDPDGRLAQVCNLVTEVPTELASAAVLTVGTTAVLLSTIAGGIPANATHALMSVAPGAGDIYYTLDGTTPVALGPGIYLPAGSIAEVTGLAAVRLIATAALTKVYPAFRRY